RTIDTILREERKFARAYIDDIVIFSKTFRDHALHLRAVFSKLEKHFIHLSPKKCFINYPSVDLLGQRVDALGLSSDKEKLAAIANLQFPRTLKQLEHYLGLTSWLRQFIPKYAQKAAPLQKRKLALYKDLKEKGFTQGPKRARQASKKHLDEPTNDELNAFQTLQKDFSKTTMLCHFNPELNLYADIDASGKGIGAMVYHSSKDPPSQKSITPITFLSRLLKPAEEKYWPTELEVAGLCWVVSKIRHMIESSRNKAIIYTDHGPTIQIATQTSMTTTSLVRMNTRHLRSSEYLARFNLEIRHKPGKLNIISDALSRLESRQIDRINIPDKSQDTVSSQLDSSLEMAYPVSYIQIGQEFVEKLKAAYLKDKQCAKLLEILNANDDEGINAANLPFEFHNGLLYAKPDQLHHKRRP
ncbi:hypothetical protein K3495_g15567, partial [Podosphaera aphanis]